MTEKNRNLVADEGSGESVNGDDEDLFEDINEPDDNEVIIFIFKYESQSDLSFY